MTVRRTARLVPGICTSLAALGLIAWASPAAAKPTTVKRSFHDCQNTALPLVAPADSPPPTNPSPVQQVKFRVPKTPKGFKPRGGKVTGASVGVRITHSFDSDVGIYLVSPQGRFIPLAAGRGDGSDDYGAGASDCTGTLTTFSDRAPTPIGLGTAPFAGPFKPEFPLSSLNGRGASGVWTVVITDTTQNDDGMVNAVSLSLNYKYKKPNQQR
jgi:subtilisin-like proprotein convertase family protein